VCNKKQSSLKGLDFCKTLIGYKEVGEEAIELMKSDLYNAILIYTAETFSENYEEHWNLEYADTDENKAIEIANDYANSRFHGKARVCAWDNGKKVKEVEIYEEDDEPEDSQVMIIVVGASFASEGGNL
jgi:hypothetical protein